MLKKYMFFIMVLIAISIALGMSYSNFKVTSENHKVAEMYIGTLKYSMTIDGSTTNTLSVPSGTTILQVTVTNENPIDTYYKLIYQNNSNIKIQYYESTKDTNDNVTNYSSPNDKITLNSTNTIKLKITNSSTSSQSITFKIVGGFVTNTLDDVTVPTDYTVIEKDTSTNTYFCTTTDTLTQGLQYVNGQYTYVYKQEGTSSSSDLAWSNIDNNGWGVQLTNKTSTDAVKSKVCTYINNKPIISMSYMFSNSQATTIDVSNFDTSNVTDVSYMFSSSEAVNLDLSNFNTSKVTSMNRMFSGSKTAILDLSSFDTSKVTAMKYMFSGSESIILDLSSFDTSNVADMDYMFSGMTNLKTIYASSSFVINETCSSIRMFRRTLNLIGGAGTTYNSSYQDGTYAHIDGGTSNPGYFTDVADKDIPEPNSFTTDSWKTIAKAARTNNTGKYNVGDTRTIDMGTYGTHTLRLANKTTPSECSTSGFSQSACGFVIEFADIITNYNMNPSGTYKGTTYRYGWNVDGWPASEMYTFVNTDIYNSLPSDLKNVIINTTIVSSHGGGDTSNFTSTDKLYLLALKEIYTNFSSSSDVSYDTAQNLTRTLDYYTVKGITTNYYSGAIKKSKTAAEPWWLRSAYSDTNYHFGLVTSEGNWISTDSYYASGVSPAFRIG